MSRRILDSWSQEIIHHTALDDYESFTWVLLWTVLRILKTRGLTLTTTEIRWLDTLSCEGLDAILDFKGAFFHTFIGYVKFSKFSDAFAPFANIFNTMFVLVKDMEERLAEFIEYKKGDIGKMAKEWAQRYAECLIDAILIAPPSWD
jgi:hypothetical protein